MLVALERDRYRLENLHPYLTGINRLAASRWLLAVGDTADAARLLTWHEAVLSPAPTVIHANAMLAGLAYLERGRIMEALGDRDRALASYQQFLRRYDMPLRAERRLVDEARTAVARLERRE